MSLLQQVNREKISRAHYLRRMLIQKVIPIARLSRPSQTLSLTWQLKSLNRIQMLLSLHQYVYIIIVRWYQVLNSKILG